MQIGPQIMILWANLILKLLNLNIILFKELFYLWADFQIYHVIFHFSMRWTHWSNSCVSKLIRTIVRNLPFNGRGSNEFIALQVMTQATTGSRRLSDGSYVIESSSRQRNGSTLGGALLSRPIHVESILSLANGWWVEILVVQPQSKLKICCEIDQPNTLWAGIGQVAVWKRKYR